MENNETTEDVLQDKGENDNLDNRQEPEGSAGHESPEDTLKVYKDLAEQQKEEIKSLLDNQKAMQAQIEQLIRGGASINDHSSDNSAKPEDKEEYESLSDLGAEIGKRDYHIENMKE